MLNMRIALSGKMASGKSLVAQYLVDNHGFTEYSFAKRLKEITTEMFNLDVAKKDERGRMILQQCADYFRRIDPMVWVHYLLRKIPSTGNVVISDVRFQNEYDTLRRLGFYMVRMVMDRPTQEKVVAKTYPGLPIILLDDKSERDLDTYDFDYVICNNGGVPLEKVYAQTELMLKEAAHGRG